MKKKAGMGKKIAVTAGVFFALGVSLILHGLWCNQALKTTQITILAAGLPDSFSGLRIAHVSDLHNASFGEDNERLLSLLWEAEPDLIAITGDIVDSNRTDVDIALDFVRQAVEIAPCYCVTGNHEFYIGEYTRLEQGLGECGVTLLRDASVTISLGGMELAILGLDDPAFSKRGDLFGEIPAMVENKLSTLKKETQDASFTLLLSHRPELFEVYCQSGVDLVLSGHDHGGQFRLPLVGGLVAPEQGFFPKYDAGLYEEGRTRMVVSRGLGNSVIPLRINNRPEIVVIDVKTK